MSDLFSFVSPESELNPDFVRLANSPNLVAARKMATEIFECRGDPDGNFIEQFQTNGFDARVFELYLAAVLHEASFKLDGSYQSPDFVADHENFGELAIEAVTANPAGNQMQDVGSMGKEFASADTQVARNTVRTKTMRAIRSKMTKKYWELSHLESVPFIIAVQCFSHADSLAYSSSALANPLYGFEAHEATKDLSKTGPGYFANCDPHLSAILFTNNGTVAKLNRMGVQKGYGCEDVRIQVIERVFDPDPSAFKPELREYVAQAGQHDDSWLRGATLFHNPNAKRPVTAAAFEDAQHYTVKAGELECQVPNGHPYATFQASRRLT